MRVVLLALACGGCIPTVPFVVGETAETLRAGEVSLGGYGGIGGARGTTFAGPAEGAMGRLRVGVGHSQEIGVEGGGYFNGRPGAGAIWGSGKLVYKLQLDAHAAVVSGFGLTWLQSLAGYGGDLALVLSTGRLGGKPVQLYSGFRMTVMLPPETPPIHGEMTGGGILPLGLMWSASRHWSVALETGFIGGGTRTDSEHYNYQLSGWYGGYGAIALSYAWRR